VLHYLHAAAIPQRRNPKETTMYYQVTAVYQDAEIGYGEGEGLAYAKQDCRESIPLIFASVRSEIAYTIVKNNDD
jgi:hypothetical protein